MFDEDEIDIKIDDRNFSGLSEQIDSINPKSVRLKRFIEKQRQRRIDQYFNTTTIISIIIVALFAYSIISGRERPQYLDFLTSLVVAYHLLKQPYEIN